VTGKGVVRFVDISPQPLVSIKKALLSCKAGADEGKVRRSQKEKRKRHEEGGVRKNRRKRKRKL
jgi:hypothetical protein